MSKEEKKKLILKRIEEGDKRSYNELVADLELQILAMKHGGNVKINKVI